MAQIRGFITRLFFPCGQELNCESKTIFCVDSLQKFEFKGAVDCLNNFHSLPGSFVQKYLIPSLTFLLKKKKVTAATHADFCLQMILLYHVASYLTGNPSQLYTFIKVVPRATFLLFGSIPSGSIVPRKTLAQFLSIFRLSVRPCWIWGVFLLFLGSHLFLHGFCGTMVDFPTIGSMGA